MKLMLRKIGVGCIFDKEGKRFCVTYLRLLEHFVLRRSVNEDGSVSLSIGVLDVAKQVKLNRPMMGQFKGVADVPLCQMFFDLRISKSDPLSLPLLDVLEREGDKAFLPGSNLVCPFDVGAPIDVVGTSKGRGFAGVMKRHNFSGQPASHGASLSHRGAGSTGQCQDIGRVIKGKKMAGHMGDVRVTCQNSCLMLLERDTFLTAVKGHVPGSSGSLVWIRPAKKRKNKKKVSLSEGA